MKSVMFDKSIIFVFIHRKR